MLQGGKKIGRCLTAFHGSVTELFRASAFYRWSAVVSCVFLCLMVALPIWRIVPISGEKPFIPLHYNVYMGVDAFGPWYRIFVLPAIGAALLVVNMAFQATLFQRERVLSAFFAVATLLAELVLLASMVFIVLLNL